jgi:hypothetical protein
MLTIGNYLAYQTLGPIVPGHVNMSSTVPARVGVLGSRFCRLFELKHIRWSVLCPDKGFHVSLLQDCFDPIIFTIWLYNKDHEGVAA